MTEPMKYCAIISILVVFFTSCTEKIDIDVGTTYQRFIVEGTIEFLKNGEIVAIVDFGDGLCDNIATKTIDGKVIEFSLEKKDSKYKKVVVEPLIKIEGCDYIVSGIVKFYEGNKWVATIDFGDGECDQWATKIWDGGSKVISLAKE